MNANVHTKVGLATASGVALLLPAMQCPHPLGYSVCGGCAIIGALLPDIDANGESKAKKEFKNVMKYLALFILCTGLLSVYNGSVDEVVVSFVQSTRFLGAVMFLILCVVGFMSGHRKFTHWLVGLVCFTFAFFVMSGDIRLALWFGVGMLSHQAIDMLNKRKITWLYPLDLDFAKYICYADSGLSRVIGGISLVLSVIFLLILTVM